jgi:hypothetical protein
VETEEQLRFLASGDCNEIQVYFVERRKPIEDYAEVLGRAPVQRGPRKKHIRCSGVTEPAKGDGASPLPRGYPALDFASFFRSGAVLHHFSTHPFLLGVGSSTAFLASSLTTACV